MGGQSVAKLKFAQVPVAEVHPNPHQPRQDFDEAGLQELAESIKEVGVQSPIRVRVRAGGGFELITGERRLRASKIAGVEFIPALVGDVEDKRLRVLAIIENVHRQDLTPIEEAHGYQALRDERDGDLDIVVQEVRKSKQHVEKRLALLTLPTEVQQMVGRGELTLGCAELLCELEDVADVIKYAKMAVKQGLSPAKLKARIQGLPRKGRSEGEGGRRPRKVTTKALSASFIQCYNLVGDFESASLTQEARETLAKQAAALHEALGILIESLEGGEAGAGDAEPDEARGGESEE